MPVEVKFDAAETRALVKDLKQLEGGKGITAALRKNLKAAAGPIAADVKAGYGWSSRIPGAVSVGTAFTAKRTGVFIKVNSKRAPHARPFENGGKPGSFRHPVYGRDTWVSQAARPTIFPRTQRRMPDVETAAGKAVEEAARAAGFR
jgi:hypothetical protein